MKSIKWLLSLASTKPLIFSIALLLIAILTLSKVVINLNRDKKDCEFENKIERQKSDQRLDSLQAYYRLRELQFQRELRETLGGVIDSYKQQLEDQREVNQKVNKTLSKNKKLINKAENQLQTLQDEK